MKKIGLVWFSLFLAPFIFFVHFPPFFRYGMFARLAEGETEPVYLEVKTNGLWREAGKKETRLPESQMNYLVAKAIADGKTAPLLQTVAAQYSTAACFRIRRGEALILDSLCRP